MAQFVSLGNKSLDFYKHRIAHSNINFVFSLVALNRIDSKKNGILKCLEVPLLVLFSFG